MNTIILKINKPFINPNTKKEHKIGEKVRVEVDKNGMPTNPYYRNRVKDSRIDGCCEIYTQETIQAKPVKKTTVNSTNQEVK